MGVSHGRAKVADLAFRVFGRPLHPEWFEVRAHRRFARDGWSADVRIVEGGHVIAWQARDDRLTEVLAGPEAALPEPGPLFRSSLRRERTAALRAGGGTEYQASFEAERVDPEVFAHLSDELAIDATRGGLFHRSGPSNRLAPAPLSHVLVESRARGLLVQSFHTFPDEWSIVRTQSLFEIGDGGPARP